MSVGPRTLGPQEKNWLLVPPAKAYIYTND